MLDRMSLPDGVEIRRANDDELERVVRLRWTWNVDERGERPAIDEQAFIAGAAAWARAHTVSHIPHVAVLNGEVIGMAWLALTPRVATTSSLDRFSGDLQSCFVLPAHRDSGIGGALVRAVLETARTSGAEHVTVHTSAGSTAMYTRNGFRSSTRLLFADVAVTEA